MRVGVRVRARARVRVRVRVGVGVRGRVRVRLRGQRLYSRVDRIKHIPPLPLSTPRPLALLHRRVDRIEDVIGLCLSRAARGPQTLARTLGGGSAAGRPSQPSALAIPGKGLS